MLAVDGAVRSRKLTWPLALSRKTRPKVDLFTFSFMLRTPFTIRFPYSLHVVFSTDSPCIVVSWLAFGLAKFGDEVVALPIVGRNG